MTEESVRLHPLALRLGATSALTPVAPLRGPGPVESPRPRPRSRRREEVRLRSLGGGPVRQPHPQRRREPDDEHERAVGRRPEAVVTPASALLALQRTHGNAAVSRAILQRKFTV